MSVLLCSFCGKAEHQVNKLIAGPDAYICNECVDLCRAIIDTGPGGTVPAPPSDDLALGATAIRLPVHVVENANRIARAERTLVHELGREPTTAEIAAASGIKPGEIETIKRRIAELTEP